MAPEPTLRAVAQAVSGLYLDERTGQRYLREEILGGLPSEVLDSRVHLSKMAGGIYIVTLPGRTRRFRLHSRRRRQRQHHRQIRGSA